MENPDRPYAVVEDFLVHNCGKKIRALIAKERQKFVDGVREHRLRRRARQRSWFDIIEPFADYAFNKSHSYGYGLVAYQTAYLKANYPVEYLAALLTSVKTNLDKAAVYLDECRQIGITVLVPDVNRSLSDFVAVPDRRAAASVIPFGLSAVRNVGEGLVALIVAEREANGPFVDFYDFCDRVDPTVLNKRTIESLIKAGGVRLARPPPPGPAGWCYEQIIDRTLARRRKEAEGQFDLFSARRPRRRPRRSERAASPIPDVGVRQAAAARLREGDARPLRERPPADGRRGRAAPPAPSAPSPSCETRRGRRDAARSAGVVTACSASAPRRATSWPCSCSRTSRPPSR